MLVCVRILEKLESWLFQILNRLDFLESGGYWPKFSIGKIVSLPNESSIHKRGVMYLSIEFRRWQNLNESGSYKGWVYGGTVYEIHNNELQPSSSTSVFSEEMLKSIIDFSK